MKPLVLTQLILLMFNIPVWLITAWKCWRVSGWFGKALGGLFLSLGLGFALMITGAFRGAEGSVARLAFSFPGVLMLSLASWVFLMFLTGRSK